MCLYVFPQVSGRLSLDSEVFWQLWKPLQRCCHHCKPDDCSSRKSCAPRSGPSCEEHGQHQGNLCRAECAAFRETSRWPWQFQGKLFQPIINSTIIPKTPQLSHSCFPDTCCVAAAVWLPDHCSRCKNGQQLHCWNPGSFSEVLSRGGVLPGKTVPLECCRPSHPDHFLKSSLFLSQKQIKQ